MAITILQEDSATSSGTSITPPGNANLMVIMMAHTDGVHGGHPGNLTWAGAAETQERKVGSAYLNGPGTWVASAAYVIERPDVSGTGTLSWADTSWDAYVFWLSVDYPESVLVTTSSGSVNGGSSCSTSSIGATGDIVFYAAASDTQNWSHNATATIDSEYNGGTGSWGFAHEDAAGAATWSGSSGIACILALAIQQGEPCVSVLGTDYAASSGSSFTRPENATYLVAAFAHSGSTHGSAPSSVSYGGQSLTQDVYHDGSGTWVAAGVYSLSKPPSGSNTFSWTGNFDAMLFWLRHINHSSAVVDTDTASTIAFTGHAAGDMGIMAGSGDDGASEFEIGTSQVKGWAMGGGYVGAAFISGENYNNITGAVAYGTASITAAAGAIYAYQDEPLTTGVHQSAFFFSLAGLALPAAMNQIVVPTTEQIKTLL